MRNWASRVSRERRGDLNSGEQVLGATPYAGHARFNPNLLRATRRVSPAPDDAHRYQAAQEHGVVPAGSFAAKLPAHGGVLVLTDQRLLAFHRRRWLLMWRIEHMAMSVPLEAVHRLAYQAGERAPLLGISFVDGSAVAAELSGIDAAAHFASSVGIPIAPPTPERDTTQSPVGAPANA